jgi:hypothetical protein
VQYEAVLRERQLQQQQQQQQQQQHQGPGGSTAAGQLQVRARGRERSVSAPLNVACTAMQLHDALLAALRMHPTASPRLQPQLGAKEAREARIGLKK